MLIKISQSSKWQIVQIASFPTKSPKPRILCIYYHKLQGKQQILLYKKLEPANAWHFAWKMTWTMKQVSK